MVLIGPVSSLFDYATFALIWFVFAAITVENQALFQMGWFVESLMTQTLIVYIIRTAQIPFLQCNPAPLMALVTLVVMACGIAFPTHRSARRWGWCNCPSLTSPGWLPSCSANATSPSC